MKYHSSETFFKNPWEQTMAAIWQRYPNPFSRHVLSEDIIERRVVGSRLFTKRLLMKTNPLPKWGQRLVHARHVAIVEESMLDRDQRILVTYTRNIGLTTTMNAVEKCIYVSAPDDESATSTKSVSTLLKREAWISSQLRGFASVIQRFGVERYKHNAMNAAKGLNYALTRLFPPHSHGPTTKSKLMHSANAVTDLIAQKVEHATAKAGAASTL